MLKSSGKKHPPNPTQICYMFIFISLVYWSLAVETSNIDYRVCIERRLISGWVLAHSDIGFAVCVATCDIVK